MLYKAIKDVAERKREEASSALHVAMFKPPGERSPTDLKTLVAQVLNHVPAIRDLQSNTKLQMAASVQVLVCPSNDVTCLPTISNDVTLHVAARELQLTPELSAIML